VYHKVEAVICQTLVMVREIVLTNSNHRTLFAVVRMEILVMLQKFVPVPVGYVQLICIILQARTVLVHQTEETVMFKMYAMPMASVLINSNQVLRYAVKLWETAMLLKCVLVLVAVAQLTPTKMKAKHAKDHLMEATATVLIHVMAKGSVLTTIFRAPLFVVVQEVMLVTWWKCALVLVAPAQSMHSKLQTRHAKAY